jgi:hypothetical protein
MSKENPFSPGPFGFSFGIMSTGLNKAYEKARKANEAELKRREEARKAKETQEVEENPPQQEGQ